MFSGFTRWTKLGRTVNNKAIGYPADVHDFTASDVVPLTLNVWIFKMTDTTPSNLPIAESSDCCHFPPLWFFFEPYHLGTLAAEVCNHRP
ncbi:hypothetical protein CEXT_702631 [Caerostris extrusa]|uniref:Uncharacterized protein n=1 Tax=Caerostris extrusa TaxID=172846 RepID=A0AAV4UL58_CAEEX|nr:hypothetical protein CEXT_702631 [Caerostris extrusa]